MATLVIDRTTSIDVLLSLMGASRLKVESNADKLVLTPASEQDEPESGYIDPANYPDTTAYLNAIPGMVESILESSNATASTFHPARPESFCA
jgi:hypothetical protein